MDVTPEAEVLTCSRGVAIDSGHVVRAMMRDARRLVGVGHVDISPVIAACFDSITDEPVWLVYSSSDTSTYLKTFLDQSRTHANVRCSLNL